MSFKRFDQQDIVISAESITAPVWSGDVVTLSEFYTSSTQIQGTSGQYYYNLYQTGSTLEEARVQLAVSYADKKGSGSLPYNSAVPGNTPSSTIYGQYRNLVLGNEDLDFTFGGETSEYFYVISIDRARYKEKLLPGTLTLDLHLSGSSAAGLTLTDDSRTRSTVTFTDSGRVYELVSGSLGVVNTSIASTGYTSNSGSYGKFLPDVGIILLNGNALDSPTSNGGMGFGTNRSASVSGVSNFRNIFNALSYGGEYKSGFRLQSEETISSNFVFVRARNAEFNYSTNPSNITGSGELRHSVMIDSPQSFITAVGLYNDNNDLLGVAKLSKPLLKDFTKESLLRIKLDY